MSDPVTFDLGHHLWSAAVDLRAADGPWAFHVPLSRKLGRKGAARPQGVCCVVLCCGSIGAA